ncbi:aldolase [Bacillus sp. RAR_GA_16]|uniref:aldolase n=1 Tax=Bacillus sp. RAR_GA_16 TaxID=2876774 RepID=UPI001CCDDFAB|nr:aldolase [Bacillus sp. RAR_GA_16]MCA0172249.1 aldolase [Bacillus sp. RAR_GA_16]
MSTAISTSVYYAFGQRIVSDIFFPELESHFEGTHSDYDVIIRKGDLSSTWAKISSQGKKYVVSEDAVMFNVPDISIFSIQEGKNITYSPGINFDEDVVRLYILGTCMGVLLMQNRILPLHGSAIAIDGKAYAIIGDSGAGKSTLASMFLQNGYHLLTDDVIALSFDNNKTVPEVTPSYPQQKLWENSLNIFGKKTTDYRSIYGRENKYSIPVNAEFFKEPLVLGGIFELVKNKEVDNVQIKEISKLEKFKTIFTHTYRNFFLAHLGLLEWHFETSASILKEIKMYQLRRPLLDNSAPQLQSTILKILREGE